MRRNNIPQPTSLGQIGQAVGDTARGAEQAARNLDPALLGQAKSPLLIPSMVWSYTGPLAISTLDACPPFRQSVPATLVLVTFSLVSNTGSVGVDLYAGASVAHSFTVSGTSMDQQLGDRYPANRTTQFVITDAGTGAAGLTVVTYWR